MVLTVILISIADIFSKSVWAPLFAPLAALFSVLTVQLIIRAVRLVLAEERREKWEMTHHD